MTAGTELTDLSDNLGRTLDNVDGLRSEVASIETTVANVRQALEYAGTIENDAKDFIHTIDGMQAALKLMGRIGPFNVVAKLMTSVLTNVEHVAETIRDQAHAIDQKIQSTGYIQHLEDAEGKLADFQDQLGAVEGDLGDYQDTVDQTVDTLNAVGAPLKDVSDALDQTAAPINDALVAVNTTYEQIQASVDQLTSQFSASFFAPLTSVGAAFDSVTRSLAFLRGPLDAVYSALKPIEPVLDLVGFLYDITVGPVVNWVLDKTGITHVLDQASAAIAHLLPSPHALDGMFAGMDQVFAPVLDFLGDGWNVDLTGMLSDIHSDILDALGADAAGDLRIGSDANDTLVGQDGVDDVLNARAGDDVVMGQGGNDILIASRGNDTLYGGDGDDRAVFHDVFSHFRFSLSAADGPVVFTHTPSFGARSLGSETVYEVEKFVFDDVKFSLNQILHNVFIATGPLLNGTHKSDFLYGGSGPVTIHGLGGDDRIIGSAQADSLYGGAGDDTIISNAGEDLVFGGGGTDTWLLPESTNSSQCQVDLVTGETWDGNSHDTISGIENVTVQDRRDSTIKGDAGGNEFQTSGGDDVLYGRGGADTIYASGGRDVIFGGTGRDHIYGGEDDDVIVGGSVVGDTHGDLYDGGDGTFDRLIYSTEYAAYGATDSSGGNLPERVPSENRVIIHAATGVIERLAADGSTVATDHAVGIEYFAGSDFDDTLFGALATQTENAWIDGGAGNDVLYTNGALESYGGKGDDRVYVTAVLHTFESTSVDGGDGNNILDLRLVEDARWALKLNGSLGTNYQAFDAGFAGSLGAVPDPDVAQVSVGLGLGGQLRNFATIYLGGHDDEVMLRGDETLTIYGGGGDDKLVRELASQGSPRATFFGQAGNDYMMLRQDGAAYGGKGSDDIVINGQGSQRVVGGAGDDVVTATLMTGSINGGAGYDMLSLEAKTSSNITMMAIDLQAGTVLDTVFLNGSFVHNIAASIAGIEEVVGYDGAFDEIHGQNGVDEKFLGRGGADTLDGRGGSDEVYGGTGNDVLQGGDGRDFLSGGQGNDVIDGGAGVDTVSYANAVPNGARGEITAGNFGAVHVDLSANLATGAAGTDTLTGVENVVGSLGDDTLIGNGARNALTGGAGDDLLLGGGGSDALVLGLGRDTAFGGSGDDHIVLGLGDAEVHGGGGKDALELGAARGKLMLDLSHHSFTGHLLNPVAVWADTGTSEERDFNGNLLTPDLVQQANPIFSDSADDLIRQLPENDDPLQPQFAIRTVNMAEVSHGTYDGIESITGGGATTRILVGSGVDSYDGSGSGTDILDLRHFKAGVHYDARSGASNAAKLKGDHLSGIDWFDGSKFGDVFKGDTADNRLIGNNGKDMLVGRAGEDVLIGGKGVDTMTGGAGDDHFVFASTGDSGNSAGSRDLITDFTVKSGHGKGHIDQIDLSPFDARSGVHGHQSFDYIGDAGFKHEGQVRAVQVGADTVISLNTTGSGGADLQITLENFQAATLTGHDFIF
ncbi:MAG: calcium-binding protein [bacterium]